MRKSPVTFPYIVKKNGREGRVKKWPSGKFGTYFRFAGKPMRNTFLSCEAAVRYLETEFVKLDTDRSNSLALAPLDGNVKSYHELEQLLRQEGSGASLREAVTFYLAHHKKKKFKPETVSACADAFVADQKSNNISPSQIKTLEKHFKRFNKTFGTRKIHEIVSLEIKNWLNQCADEKTGKLWSVKTKTSVLGSLVSLSFYAKDQLHAIPEMGGKTEFQLVKRPKADAKGEVEIYTPDELKTLLESAIENDVDMIPIIVLGAFQGLRPAEAHGEGVNRAKLPWESFAWDDGVLWITGQKVRSKQSRSIPIHSATKKWLAPFMDLKGAIWMHKQAHSKKLISLRKKAKVRSISDGFRHSYASYRIRQLKNDLTGLAGEMGNSPKELIDSYKKNVTDSASDQWFSIFPPADYVEKIKAVLALRNPA